MNPRTRRLLMDFQKIDEAFAGSSFVWIEKMEGNPPERYRVVYRVPSLKADASGRVTRSNEHVMEVSLPVGYPRQPPHCSMATQIFHPNIDSSAVCFGDFWAAEESLANLIGRIGEMITFQSYNIKSPLNPEAAVWVSRIQDSLPLAVVNFFASRFPQIIVRLSSGKQKICRVGIRGLTVGTRPGPNRLAITGDPRLSESHCQIAPRFGNITVCDFGSQTGTTVDGIPVAAKPVVVSPNSLIQAGSVTIKPKR